MLTLITFLIDWLRRVSPSIRNESPHIATYTRELPVSLDRMYENAIDGEHLPWLHSTSFSDLHILKSGHWGWHAKGHLQPRSFMTAMELELRLDKEKNRWITTTLSGLGKGSQIITHAIPIADNNIKVIVDFYVPKLPKFLHSLYAEQFIKTYTLLYDEDLWMMATRQNELNRLALGTAQNLSDEVILGSIHNLREQLPFAFDFKGHPFQLIDLDGELLAYSSMCPHMLGPLTGDVIEGVVECPWHGYQFDVKSRHCLNKSNCKLAPAPRIDVEPTTQNVIAKSKNNHQ